MPKESRAVTYIPVPASRGCGPNQLIAWNTSIVPSKMSGGTTGPFVRLI